MNNISQRLRLIREELLNGGLSDNMSVRDIADKHNVDISKIREQILKGIRVEAEHTNEVGIAKKIAMDHLVEDPLYYDKLAKLGI
jgi:Trp operon repressor